MDKSRLDPGTCDARAGHEPAPMKRVGPAGTPRRPGIPFRVTRPCRVDLRLLRSTNHRRSGTVALVPLLEVVYRGELRRRGSVDHQYGADGWLHLECELRADTKVVGIHPGQIDSNLNSFSGIEKWR